MKVSAINDYFTTNLPCLHMSPSDETGAYLFSMTDSNSAIITIYEKEYRTSDNELDFLMTTPIELGAYEKNGHVMPMIKIGPNNDPYLYVMPFDPVLPDNQKTIDFIAESRHIIVCFVEGEKDLVFKGIRVLGIPDFARDYLINKWIKALEQGAGYSLKYLNFLNLIENMEISDVWSQSHYLGELEE